MRVVQELGRLGWATVLIWWRGLPELLRWCALGLTGATLGLFGSALIGGAHQGWATLVFILGVLAQALCTVMMLASARRWLRSPVLLRENPAPGVPTTVFTATGAGETVLATLGPFLIIYSLWGLVEDRVTALFRTNLMIHGVDAASWSIGFDRWRFFLVVAIVAFAVKQVLQVVSDVLAEHRSVVALGRTGVIVLEAVWIFASFVAVTGVAPLVASWVLQRHLTATVLNTWYTVSDAVPPIELFGATLRHLLAGALPWMWETLLPAIAESVAQPLFWLALTAVVHGWRQFSVREVLGETAGSRLERTEHGALAMATRDLREKYLPVLASLRLLLHAGPYLIAAYLIWAAVLQWADPALTWAITQILPAWDEPTRIALVTPLDTLVQFVLLPWAMALYLAAFDRSITASTRAARAGVRTTVPASRPAHRSG